ncbi:MAG: DUF3800 domain-containing protein [Deltaproteobacteria bacterium]|nr:DUF3800 domain-containing protein [Deltaproteobacteria bacterium]
MPFVVYLDETGDHSLELVDKDFPLFGLVLLICDQTTYVQNIVPTMCQIKMDYFGHEAVVIHSRDIRKAQGEFGFLTNPENRPAFYDRINQLMSESDYHLIATVIRKQLHKDRYGMWAENPYDLALKFAMERLLPLLEDAGQDRANIVAEARGKREDDELRLSFLRIVNDGTEYISAERFKQIQFQLHFKSKSMNIVGTQMADLAAYPIARYVLDPNRPNPAYDIIKDKFYRGRGWVRGLKIFP